MLPKNHLHIETLLWEATEENVTEYRDLYYDLSYSLLKNLDLVFCTTKEQQKKAEEDKKVRVDEVFDAASLYLHKPEYEGLDLTNTLWELQYLPMFERLLFIIVSADGKKVLDTYAVCDNKPTNVGSVYANRELMQFLMNSVVKYGIGIGLITAHNHPFSIKATPSKPDYSANLVYGMAARMIGISILDSFIITDFDLFSFEQDAKNRGIKSHIKTKGRLTEEQIETLNSIDPKLSYIYSSFPFE